MRLKVPYLGNPHGPADEVGISQLATILGKLLFVDEDKAVVLYTVTVSTVIIRRAGLKTGHVVRAQHPQVLIEVDG